MFEKNFDDYINPEFFELVERFEKMLDNRDVGFFEESALEQIVEYYEEMGDHKKVLDAIGFATEQYPFSSFFLIKKAQIFFDERNNDEALEVLEKAEIFSPSDISIYLLRADIFLWNGMHENALEEVQKAFSHADEEEYPDLYLEKADVFEDWEKYSEVFINLEKTLEIDPENYEALERMWFCVEILENYEESIDFHTKLIDRKPYSYQAWYNLANAYSGLGFFEKAIEYFEFAIAINEKHHYAFRDCAEVLFKLKDYKKAAEYFQEAAILNQTNRELSQKEIYFKLGLCNKKLNDLNRARYYFRKATKLDPYMHEAFFQIGKTYAKEGKYDNAIHSFERAVKVNDQNTKYLKALAKALSKCSDFTASAKHYGQALSVNPNDVSTWKSYVLSTYKTDELSLAVSRIDEAIKHFPDESALLFIKAAFLYENGRRNSAIDCFEIACSKDYNAYFKAFQIYPSMFDDSEIIRLMDIYKTN
ncbi:MAG: tetratricopeptide repeat protein [Chitinophagaceae bacterium]|nr:MAG: tetratricopeptide repeat protein [Chitinophagaceae bacterium]